MNMTPSSLSQQFKRCLQKTPMDYLNALKIQRAKYYLSNTNMTVKEIVAQLGYVSESSFVRMFRQKADMTPGEYRKRASGLNQTPGNL